MTLPGVPLGCCCLGHGERDSGPNIIRRLQRILSNANEASRSPWSVHIAFETLHPYMDGKGRTGRAIWAWQMQGLGHDPFTLPFLHRFYYQTLDANERRASKGYG
jgi:Fic/DOC family